MPKLPTGDHKFYVGIDPGFTGAISCINAVGTTVKVWDMPIIKAVRLRRREFDLNGLQAVFKHIRRFPDVVVGLEWPTTRPGEGAERCERFGRGKGILQAMLHVMKLEYYLISPNLWKGRLGIPGKTNKDANKLAAKLFDIYYAEYSHLLRGPRGGIKDGRADACLIAHFLRTNTMTGMRSIVEKHGKNSAEALAFVLGSGRGKMRL